MRVKVVDGYNCSYIKNGEVYEVLRDNGMEYAIFTPIDKREHYYPHYRFIVLSDNLMQGWKYCRCGAITANSDKCCECMEKNTT